MTDNKSASETLSFEESLSELEALVLRMEAGELSLESSLQEFERGIGLIRSCQQVLSQAEQKVTLLMAEGDTRDFSQDEA